MTPTFPNDPISTVEWRDAATLNANDYNPNMVLTPELRLLERSILKTGWVQPVLISRDGIIIDGFHRCMLSRESKALRATYQGLVPCAVLDVDRAHAMILTVRMNRAKGTHVALRMASMVKELIDEHGVDPAVLAEEMGASKDEILTLYQDSVFKARNIADYRYSRAWVPAQRARVEDEVEE